MTGRPRTTGRPGEPRRAPALAARVVVAAALGAVVVAALGACSVEVVQDEPAGASTQPRTGATDDTAPDDTGATDDSDDTAADGTPARTARPARSPGTGGDPEAPGGGTLDRRTLEARATQHMTCGGGDLVLATAAAAVVVDDACGSLAVEGAGVVVVARDVERLTVAASSVRVVVARVGSVELDAADVRVAWEDGSPTVDDLGAGNAYGPVGTVDLDLATDTGTTTGGVG